MTDMFTVGEFFGKNLFVPEGSPQNTMPYFIYTVLHIGPCKE